MPSSSFSGVVCHYNPDIQSHRGRGRVMEKILINLIFIVILKICELIPVHIDNFK
jgi:hypothetical protein